MPTTGAAVSSRAASSPGSPKHAIRYASQSGSACTSAATSAAATTESAALSIDVGPRFGLTAVTSHPSGSAARATPPMASVWCSSVLGLISASRNTSARRRRPLAAQGVILLAGQEAARPRLGQDLAVAVHRLAAHQRAYHPRPHAPPVEGRPRVLRELLRAGVHRPLGLEVVERQVRV